MRYVHDVVGKENESSIFEEDNKHGKSKATLCLCSMGLRLLNKSVAYVHTAA
jgi:hypothetical protein